MAVLLTAGAALARSIYLNGVKVDGLTNQVFKGCQVQIDDQGNVYITAPGYQVKTVGQDNSNSAMSGPATKTRPTTMTKRYWLVTQVKGDAQYDVDVYINSKWIKKIRSTDEQIVYEITKYLNPGQNKVHFSATKNLSAGRKSFSKTVFLRIIIGEGNMGGDNVMIDNPIIDKRWTAAETNMASDDFDLYTR
ncbi:MAG: hypothetical protein GXP49_06210 [Deltaproteobacteria bacterium]|nr:hypothetical protein [Deltaproteobacteria bacterium]